MGEVDLAEALLAVGDAERAQLCACLGARGQVVDEFLVERELGQIARVRGHAFVVVRDVVADLRGIELAQARDLVQVFLPDPAHPVAIGFFRRIGCAVEDVRFARRLERADPDQVHVDAELVERVLEVAAVVREAFEQYRAVRIEQDPVRVCGEEILVLVHAAGDRDDLLAGSAEAVERHADVAQGRKSRAVDLVGNQHDALDACIFRGRADHAQQVAQLHFLDAVASEVGQRALGRIGAVLLDDRAFRIEHQRGARAKGRARCEQRAEEPDQHDQENQVEDQQAGEVERVPQAAEEAADHAGIAG